MIPNARTLITITQPFGEYHAHGKASVPPMLYAEMVAQAGINFEAFALEIEMGVPEPGMFVRVGAGTKRKVHAGGEGIEMLITGGSPGKTYEIPEVTELEGAA